MENGQFSQRIAFGVWLNDFRNTPITSEEWPSIRLDENIITDFKNLIIFLENSGFTALDIFGLVTNSDWTPEIASVIDERRKNQITELIDFAHSRNIEIIYGLGVYSWGFNTIIQHDHAVKGTNPQVMCGSSSFSRQWMQKVIDFVGDTFDVDGYHLEVADLGRCECEKCRNEEDVEYYSRINRETAEYIRSRWPGKLLLVNTSGYLPWGDTVGKEGFKHIYGLGKAIDVFIDGGNHGLFIDESDRKELIRNLECEYGTSGGFWVYPPQHWDRLRWFLPYVRRDIEHLRQLYRDGSRACELYLGPLLNPGTEMNILCNGIFLRDVRKDSVSVMEEAIDILYKPKDGNARSKLAEIFFRAEEAFFDNWSERRLEALNNDYSDGISELFKWSTTKLERAIPGELFLEPLLGDKPGFPVYLAVHMTGEGRKRYRKELRSVLKEVTALRGNYADDNRIDRIVSCVENVIGDIDLVEDTLA